MGARLKWSCRVPEPLAGQGIEILAPEAESSGQPEIEEFCQVLASIVYRILTEEEAGGIPSAS